MTKTALATPDRPDRQPTVTILAAPAVKAATLMKAAQVRAASTFAALADDLAGAEECK